jgi:hypothetical protein
MVHKLRRTEAAQDRAMPTRNVRPKEPPVLIDSHCEGVPLRPIAPPSSLSGPAIKLGLIRSDFEPASALAREGASP